MAEVKPDLVVLDGDMPSALDPDLLATLQGEGRDDVRTGRPCNTANHLAKPQDVAVPVVLLQSSQLPVGGLRPSRRITKPYSPKALAKTVHSVLVEARDARAGARRAANRLRAGGLELDIDQHSVERVGSTPKQRADLPPTEWRLLHHLMREPGRTHTRAEIRSAVWGDHAAVDERTVDQSVRRLRAVLAQLQAENALQTVRGLGYRIEPLPDRDRA
jgi:DNA-binding winged helix-turn-helix (wHTH) protein